MRLSALTSICGGDARKARKDAPPAGWSLAGGVAGLYARWLAEASPATTRCLTGPQTMARRIRSWNDGGSSVSAGSPSRASWTARNPSSAVTGA